MVKIVAENFRNLIKSVGGNKFGAGVLYLATHTRMALTLKNSKHFFSQNIYADFTVFYHPLFITHCISVNSWSSSHVSCIVCLVS